MPLLTTREQLVAEHDIGTSTQRAMTDLPDFTAYARRSGAGAAGATLDGRGALDNLPGKSADHVCADNLAYDHWAR